MLILCVESEAEECNIPPKTGQKACKMADFALTRGVKRVSVRVGERMNGIGELTHPA